MATIQQQTECSTNECHQKSIKNASHRKKIEDSTRLTTAEKLENNFTEWCSTAANLNLSVDNCLHHEHNTAEADNVAQSILHFNLHRGCTTCGLWHTGHMRPMQSRDAAYSSSQKMRSFWYESRFRALVLLDFGAFQLKVGYKCKVCGRNCKTVSFRGYAPQTRGFVPGSHWEHSLRLPLRPSILISDLFVALSFK